MIKIGKIHGRIEVYKIINDVPYYPEEGKKGKIKWQATVLDPNRLAIFKDIDSEEEALMILKEDNKVFMESIK